MATFKTTDMPALTIDAQSQLTSIESKYNSILSGHCSSYQIHDPDGALEKIRTFATLFFDFYYSFYSQFPTHSEHWKNASETKALERISVHLKNFTATRNWVDASIVLTIKTTIINHAKTKVPQRIMPVTDFPRIPTLGGTFNEAPLITMAKSLRHFDEVAAKRKAFIQPLLDAKGWSLAQWAEKAKISRHTAKDYYENKRSTYHSNRRALAEALGVSFQDFPK